MSGRRGGRGLTVLLGGLALTLVGTVGPVAGSAPAPATAKADPADRPNVIVVMTDDQEVASLDHMPTVQRMRKRGVTFAKHTSSFSLCCPARATFFLGQYAHNHRVRGNFARPLTADPADDPIGFEPIGGYGAMNTDETLGVWMQRSGYVTSHIGKYLNGYDQDSDPETDGVPAGWTEWHGGVDPTTYWFHNYLLNDDGVVNFYGEGPENYQTDVLTDKAVDFIERRSGADEPFFLSMAYLAPHWEVRPDVDDITVGDLEGLTPNDTRLGVPPRPAERHAHLFPGLKAPRPPSFDEADVSDKPAFVRAWPRLDQAAKDEIDEWYLARIRSLQAIDEGLARIETALAEAGELDNTYIVFTADNGFLQGEHRLPLKKVDVYEPSTRIPLVVTGPRVGAGGQVQDWTSNVDLHATVLDLAGVSRPGATFPLDGISLAPYLADPQRRTGRVVMHESYDDLGEIDYQAVRVGRWKYVRHATGETELYDLRNDPHELSSQHRTKGLGKLRKRLKRMLGQQGGCVGTACLVEGYGEHWDVNARVRHLRVKQVGRNKRKVRVRVRVRNTGRTKLTGLRVVAKQGKRVRAAKRINLGARKSRRVTLTFRWRPSMRKRRTYRVVLDPGRKFREATRTDNVVRLRTRLNRR